MLRHLLYKCKNKYTIKKCNNSYDNNIHQLKRHFQQRLFTSEARPQSPRREDFSRHWHISNLAMSLTPAIFLWYYLHFVVRDDMHNTASKLKNKNNNDDDTNSNNNNNNDDDINVDIDSNSIRGRRRKRNLESKIEALEQKLNDVIDSLNEKQTNSKLKDVVQDEQLNGKEEEETTHKK